MLVKYYQILTEYHENDEVHVEHFQECHFRKIKKIQCCATPVEVGGGQILGYRVGSNVIKSEISTIFWIRLRYKKPMITNKATRIKTNGYGVIMTR